MKTTKTDNIVSHSLELLSNMIRGINSGDIDQMQINAMSDGTRGLVQFRDMLYSIEVRPLFEKVAKDDKPTLRHVFLNDVDICDEPECDGCEHQQYDAGNPDIESNTCCPPSYECVCTEESECPAAVRKLEDLMDDYDAENETGNYAPIFGDTGIDKLTIRGDEDE